MSECTKAGVITFHQCPSQMPCNEPSDTVFQQSNAQGRKALARATTAISNSRPLTAGGSRKTTQSSTCICTVR